MTSESAEPSPARPDAARSVGAARAANWAGSFVALVGAAVTRIARHWLALALLGTGAFVGLPIAAPVLAMTGHDRLAGAIYFAYRFTCHQFPHRSWFLGGRAPAYDWETVRHHLGVGPRDLLAAFHNPIRDPVLGYQVALCQRDVAIFGSLVVALAVFALLRRRRAVRALPFRAYALSLVPLAIDGLTQIVGLRESTPIIRTVTGAIFGGATAWLVFPQIDEGMREIDPGGPTPERPPAPDQRE